MAPTDAAADGRAPDDENRDAGDGDGADGGPQGDAMVAGPDAGIPGEPWGYDEPYRPQFHFTAPTGWLNDANGMWYANGLYHFSYQAVPESLGDGPKYWGHAVSEDMMHWENLPPMLVPNQPVPGAAWSGSTVVDLYNTSGFQTGDAPVLVTLYTATDYGTALVYSNDHGSTWTPYAQNPVAIGTANHLQTRDPHVFWHAPTSRWVCVIWEEARGGMAFYTSPDLKTWTYRSSVPFGFECPGMFELAIDGDSARKKWVLHDAAGAYLLGSFDGSTFVADSATERRMDQSDHYYAGQPFFRPTLPSDRVVNMAWIRSDPNVTGPWNQAISFPTETVLKTFPSGVRLARTPIAEISTLHRDARHQGSSTVPAGASAFPGWSGTTFDAEFVIDLGASAASSVTVQLGNTSFSLDLAARTAFGATFSSIGGRATVRILRDLGQYEVFINGGEVVYTRGFAFTPGDATFQVTGNDALAIRSADFRRLARVWPGAAALQSRNIDDSDTAATTYQGRNQGFSEDRYFANTCTVVFDTGGSLEVRFTGTRVDWYGLKNTDLGKLDVYLDGQLAASQVDAYDPVRQNARLFTAQGLTSGEHVLRVVVTGQKNAASSGVALVHDFVVSYVDP